MKTPKQKVIKAWAVILPNSGIPAVMDGAFLAIEDTTPSEDLDEQALKMVWNGCVLKMLDALSEFKNTK